MPTTGAAATMAGNAVKSSAPVANPPRPMPPVTCSETRVRRVRKSASSTTCDCVSSSAITVAATSNAFDSAKSRPPGLNARLMMTPMSRLGSQTMRSAWWRFTISVSWRCIHASIAFEHVGGLAGYRAGGGHATRSEDARGEPVLVFRRHGTRALFGERLPEILRRQSDFFAELDQLFFGELVAALGVGGCALQLRGASQHALE